MSRSQGHEIFELWYMYVAKGLDKCNMHMQYESPSAIGKKVSLPITVGHDGHANCEEFPICDDRITENDRCVIKIIGIH